MNHLFVLVLMAVTIELAAGQQPNPRLRDLTPQRTMEDVRIAGSMERVDSSRSANRLPFADNEGEQRILQRIPSAEPWFLALAGGFEWQDNPALLHDGGEESAVWRNTVSIGGTWAIGRDLFFQGGGARRTYRYDKFDLLSFDQIEADGGLLWSLPDPLSDWAVGASLKWYRMNTVDSWNDDFFTNTVVQARALKAVQISRHHLATITLSAEWSVNADDESAQRDEYAVVTGWQAQWSPRVHSILFGRVALFDYDERTDWNFMAGVTLEYILTESWRLGLTASTAVAASEAEAFDYTNSTGGITVQFSRQF